MSHPSALELDSFLSATLSPDRRDAVEAHVAGCPRCGADLEAFAVDRRRFTAEVFPRTLARATQNRRAPWVLPVWIFAPVMAATAMVLILVTSKAHDSTAAKGGPALQVVAKRGERVFSVTDGIVLAPGDQIRFVVEPLGNRYLLVAGMDGAGQVTVYYPYGGAASAVLPAGARVEIPGSIILDDAPGPERVVAVFSPTPIEARPVVDTLAAYARQGAAAIRAAHSPPVPGTRASVFFEKERP